MFWFAIPDSSVFWSVHSATICSAEPNSVESDSPVSEIGGSEISRTSNEISRAMTASSGDWRTPVVCYLENPGHIADRKFRWQALKYVMLDNTLYCRTIDGLLLKCLGSDQSKIAMGEVHECI
jgi:hypothetical protein